MLHVVATPIGNLGDLSPRAAEAFRNASLIACEDTRRTWQLLAHLGVPRPEMISYRQGNEERVAETVVAAVRAGREVVLASDGGYPAISDPGYRLVRKCAQENVPFEVIPGASAVNVALIMSGLSTSSFTFRGFPPRGPGALRNWFAEDADKERSSATRARSASARRSRPPTRRWATARRRSASSSRRCTSAWSAATSPTLRPSSRTRR